MPLESLRLPDKLKKRLSSRLRKLLREGSLNIEYKMRENCYLGFCISIQIIPKKQTNTLVFGRPEGVRMFVNTGDKIIAAIDFRYLKNRLQLIEVYQGNGLRDILAALTSLELMYAKKKGSWYVELISFVLAPGFYLMVHDGKERQFYNFTEDEFQLLTAKQLIQQVYILIDRHNKAKTS